jgi:membrane-bound serine protease (ClpP class)
MALGSLMLFEAPESDLRVSLKVIIPTVIATAGIFFFAITIAVRALRRPPTTGAQALVGQVGVTRSPLAPTGDVFIQGELWKAVAEGGEIREGERVQVVGIENLTLRVKGAREGLS